MKKILKYFCFLVFPFALIGQGFEIENYLAKEGLAQSQVYTMLCDSRGFIWAGTQGGGLSRFDGKQFQTFYSKNGNYINALEESDDGNIWIGSDKGLTVYEGDTFQIVLKNELSEVKAIMSTKKNNLWVGTPQGIWIFEENKWSNPGREQGFSNINIKCFYEDKEGKVWIGTQRGVLVYQEGKLKWLDTVFGLTDQEIRSITQDGKDAIWIATANQGVKILKGNTSNILDFNNGLSSNNLNCLLKDNIDRMWIGTADAGVSIWNPDDGSIQYLQENNGLESSDIRQIILDPWGNFWLGTSGGGISKCVESNFPFDYFNENKGLFEREVYAVTQDADKNIWLATGRGLFKKSGNSFENFDEAKGFINRKSQSLLYDQKDRLWIGTERNGLALFEDGRFEFIHSIDGPGLRPIRALTQDSTNNIWLGTAGNGIYKLERKDSVIIYYDKTQLDSLSILLGNLSRTDSLLFRRDSILTSNLYTRLGRTAGLNDRYINCLYTDQDKKIWYGTANGGLGFIKNGKRPFHLTQEDGLPDSNIRSITADSSGNIWAGTATEGIIKIEFSNDSFNIRSYNKTDGLFSDNIYLLKFDDEQNLWAGNQSGVDKMSFDEAYNINTIQSFGIFDGFEGGETCRNSVYKDDQGNMWFGTMQGLMKYTAGRKYFNPVPPRLHINSVQLFYKSLKETEFAPWAVPYTGMKEGLILPHNQNSIGFDFEGINLSNTAKIKYQWKLAGYETEWSPLVEKNSVNYSNLPPGEYEFNLRAYNESNVFNDPPFSLSFSIEPPYWHRWWFRIATAALVLFLIGSVFKWRLNRERKKAKIEKERLELEKNLLLLEQKALQLQMNPHFIFNALNSIQNLIGKNDSQSARYQLAKFSKLMRLTLENSRENTISLEQESNALDNYLALEKFSRGDSFDYEIICDDFIDMESVYIPPMLIQPFVENAIVHGVAHIQKRGKITVEFKEHEAKLICEVTDNGIGRKKATELKSQIDQQHKSVALTVTRERLDNLFPGKNNKDSLTIEDLIDDNKKVIGTKVRLLLPMLIK